MDKTKRRILIKGEGDPTLEGGFKVGMKSKDHQKQEKKKQEEKMRNGEEANMSKGKEARKL